MNTIRRKQKSKIENDKDFYQTNPLMIKSLVAWIERFTPCNEHLKILDPCCGEGVISKGLRNKFYNITAIDRYIGIKKRNFLLHKDKYDLIVMNPPYTKKYDFINKARKQAKMVVCLLPLNVSNYNDFSRNYEDIPDFVGKLQMSPKMFLDKTTEFKAGGTAQYCWYMWEKGNNNDFSITWYDDLRKYQKAN